MNKVQGENLKMAATDGEINVEFNVSKLTEEEKTELETFLAERRKIFNPDYVDMAWLFEFEKPSYSVWYYGISFDTTMYTKDLLEDVAKKFPNLNGSGYLNLRWLISEGPDEHVDFSVSGGKLEWEETYQETGEGYYNDFYSDEF